MVSCICAKTDISATSIKLKLAKESLALAEANILTIEITNNLETPLLLDNEYLFKATKAPYPFKLYLIAPDGSKWLYVRGRGIRGSSLGNSPRYFWLPPGGKVQETMYLWATAFAPTKYKNALEKIPSGKYKLFAIYKLPITTGTGMKVLYSDTAEFTYRALDEKDAGALNSLMGMDSLKESILGVFGPKDKPQLVKIRDSKTPYSEAAYSILLALILASIEGDPYDQFVIEKRNFDALYPNSSFAIIIMNLQMEHAKLTRRTNAADSLRWVLQEKYPLDRQILISSGRIKTATLKEYPERRTE